MYRPTANLQMTDSLMKKYEWLVDLIPTGKDEAISMKMLSRITGYPTADIRQYVLNARRLGILICSGEQGYYFPKDLGELQEFIHRRDQYIKTACVALHAFKKTLKGANIEECTQDDKPPSEARQTPLNGISLM